MSEYTIEKCEQKCEAIRRENEDLLKLFEEDMKDLSSKTIRKHLDNVDFYLNHYLLHDEP